MSSKSPFFAVLLVLACILTPTCSEIRLSLPSFFPGGPSGSGGNDGFVPGGAPGDVLEEWDELYAMCVENYTTCRDDREGCQNCELTCKLLADDAIVEETKDYLMYMSTACETRTFRERDAEVSVREMQFGSALFSV